MASQLSMLDTNSHVDKLTSDIFSILENKFLFGNNKVTLQETKPNNYMTGKVRILSIDGGDPFLVAASLSRLETSLRRHSGDPSAALSDFFDLAAGSGPGGLLAALLFTRGSNSRPLFTAEEALNFLANNRRRLLASPEGLLRRVCKKSSSGLLTKVFGEATLKDTCKPLLIPCYEFVTGGAFVFSRADALESDGYDFKLKDVCGATLAGKAMDIRSVDGRRKISVVGGEVVMNNPTVTAITHVLNNKNEFPFCNGVEDLLVVSLGNSQSGLGHRNVMSSPARGFVQIAGEGASDLVDQAVSMAFGESRASNYVRIQTNGPTGKITKGHDLLGIVEEMLAQKNVESVLFHGKRFAKNTNLEKLQIFAAELVKEQERRKTSILPTVVLKHGSPSPRSSSATTLSSLSSN